MIRVRVALTQGSHGLLQGRSLIGGLEQFFIKALHEYRRTLVVHIPQTGNDLAAPCAKKGPRQTYQPFAGIGAFARAVAGGNDHDPGVDWDVDDFACIQLETVFFR